MSNFFSKGRKLQSRFGNIFFAVLHQQILLTALGKNYTCGVISELSVSKMTTEHSITNPSNTYYGSVKGVVLFNNIFLSSSGATWWKTSREWLGVHRNDCWMNGCVGTVCCLWVSIFPWGDVHDIWIKRSKIRKKIEKYVAVVDLKFVLS